MGGTFELICKNSLEYTRRRKCHDRLPSLLNDSKGSKCVRKKIIQI